MRYRGFTFPVLGCGPHRAADRSAAARSWGRAPDRAKSNKALVSRFFGPGKTRFSRHRDPRPTASRAGALWGEIGDDRLYYQLNCHTTESIVKRCGNPRLIKESEL